MLCDDCEHLVTLEDELVGIVHQECYRRLPIRGHKITRCTIFTPKKPKRLYDQSWTRNSDGSWEKEEEYPPIKYIVDDDNKVVRLEDKEHQDKKVGF